MSLFEQFNSEIAVNLIYILAAMLFIFGLKMLGSPETARKGNLTSASGMFLAVVVTLLDQSIIDFSFILIGVCIGSVSYTHLTLPTIYSV